MQRGDLRTMRTVTLTYAECVENHIGNQKIGSKLHVGMSTADLHATLNNMKAMYPNITVNGQVISLTDKFPDAAAASLDASVLIIKGLTAHTNDEMNAMFSADWDAKYWDTRRQTVLNKNARHNLCFTDTAQEPNYESGLGRTYAFNDCPAFMSKLRYFFSNTISVDGRPYSHYFSASNVGSNANIPLLLAEGNYYYNHANTYIGWHGDTERSLVVGYRLGSAFPLHFMLFAPDRTPVPQSLQSFNLENGDAYIMSYDATGNNWKKKGWAFRHSAGHAQILNKTQTHKI